MCGNLYSYLGLCTTRNEISVTFKRFHIKSFVLLCDYIDPVSRSTEEGEEGKLIHYSYRDI